MLVGASLQTASTNMAQLIAGRIVTGLVSHRAISSSAGPYHHRVNDRAMAQISRPFPSGPLRYPAMMSVAGSRRTTAGSSSGVSSLPIGT